jgi:Icc-related predicted phosphoesterase
MLKLKIMSPLKVRILSDTHLETYNGKFDEAYQRQNPNFEALVKLIEKRIPTNDRKEVLVLPGDLGYVVNEKGEFSEDMGRFLRYCKSRWNIVILVPGNTEYHGIRSFETFITTEEMIKEKCKEMDIIYLNKGVCMIDGHFFVGCTLWSYINFKEWKKLKDQDKDMFMDMDIYRRMYVDNLEWLSEILYAIEDRNYLHNTKHKAVVITHYPPETECKNPSYTIKEENGKNVKVNHVDKFIDLHKETIKAWVCGHIHDENLVKKVKVPLYLNSVGESFEGPSHLKSGLFEV